MEKAINFKIDADLYRKIKVKIALQDKTLKDYIIALIKKDLEENKGE
ncbi:hypothetical protein FACS189490_13810 [Clostridia bacterium]|nr:hypothetical protein FACS189490_13810 [Clostridia bacterium]